ncbi:MAG: signal recognition particle receptor subunit alpha, partial [Candidatus Micrarchaeota archaeon]
MFGLLKDKFSSFINSISKQEEETLKVNLSLESKLKSAFSSEVELKEKDVDDLLNRLELSLLEADVAYEVAQAIVLEIKGKLIGKKVRSGGVKEAVREVVKEALKDAMEGSGGKTHVDIL